MQGAAAVKTVINMANYIRSATLMNFSFCKFMKNFSPNVIDYSTQP